MKKNLLILGLLLCTTGFAFADETTAQLPNNTVQQAEIQSQIDRSTFENYEKQNKFNKSLKGDPAKDKVKYDKSVTNHKYKNFDSKYPNRGKFDKQQPKINEYHNFRPEMRANRKPDIFRPKHKPLPKGYIGKYNHKMHKPVNTMHRQNKKYRRA